MKRVSEEDDPVGTFGLCWLAVKDGSAGAEEPGKAGVAPAASLNGMRRSLRLCLCRCGFHEDCVSIRKALKAVSQVLDGRVEGDRRGSPRYLYNAGSAGLVGGAGYLTRRLGVGFCIRHIWQDVPQYKMIV